MKIYTKTGDKGMTYLYGGKIVFKSDSKIETYGTIDELSSFIGLVIAKINDKNIKEILIEIQKDLYQLMSILSIKEIKNNQNKFLMIKNHLEAKVKKFEQIIDNFDKKLPKINRFILPTGTETSCWFHILRVFCRKTERIIVKYIHRTIKKSQSHSIKKMNNIKIKYLNRLSDLFFILARYYNQNKEIFT